MHTIVSTYHRLGRVLAVVFSALLVALAGAVGARASTLVISGAGWGHGVGMSQDGALGFAEHGWSDEAILAHYYRGTTLGTVAADTRVRVLIGGHVRSLGLEDYVRGVVSAEMPASWPAAALEAQAIASRTYALTAHDGGSAFDVFSDTRSQMYRGSAAYTPQTDAAVAATAGQVVTYAGAPAITYFFASSGGRTESVQNAFIGSLPEPWLVSVRDPYDAGPLHSWTLSLGFSTAAARLGSIVRGHFRGIEVLRRAVSPRILSAYVLGSGGRTSVSGADLAARLGLYDTWAYFSVRRGTTLTAEPDRSARAPSGGGSTQGAAPSAPASGPGGGVPAGGEGAPASGAAAGGASAPA
jgi:stage II sporulation protein D